MTAWRIPPPARGAPAAAGKLSAERWLCGVAASYEEWPQAEYTFRLPGYGLPVYVGHEAERIVTSGFVPGDVGAARRFAEIDGLGVVVLIEISADYPSLLWDVSAGKRCGLSVCAHIDEPPGGGQAWVYFSEVSLTEHPQDPRARVVSSGTLALQDWQDLAGEAITG
ncbi:MAG TPA: hypothetical protein VFQ68_16415 [Streptosporangiaceae bacterium]|nr:hypothetical protein [Streptosporangiaceae bacterium]